MKDKVLLGSVLMLVLALPLLGIWLHQWWQGGSGVTLQRGPVVGFDWTDINGRVHSLHAWDDGITLVFLGYLTCSDYCPLRLQQLRELAALWPAETSPPLRFLFITLDPAHDTPAQRREIIDGQGPQMFSATLTADALQQLQQQLREQVAVRDGAISHAGNLYLLDGERRLRRVYPATELSPAALLEDIRQLDAGAHTPVQLQ